MGEAVTDGNLAQQSPPRTDDEPGFTAMERLKAEIATELLHSLLPDDPATWWSKLDEILGRLRAATTGSVHPRVAEAIGEIEFARQKLDDVQTLTLAAIEAAQSYRAVI